MESSGDSYLHKKFKKQLTIDVRSQNNDKDIKEAAPLREQSEEKKVSEQQQRQCNPPVTDNNGKIVPNQSTNTSSSPYSVNPSSTTVKSSISVDSQQQPSNSCISHIESLPASFDTKFSDQTTNFVNSTSSILDNYYPSYPYDYSVKQDEQDSKSEEARQGDKASGGNKYVCSYCNMVCSKPSVLQKHIRAHTNERPYPCKSCGFSFKTRSNLYKHCRSRTHANRVLGSKMQDSNGAEYERTANYPEEQANIPQKPYKPRFHTSSKQIFEAKPESESRNHRNPASEMLSHHINEIISKNNSIVNSKEEDEEDEEEDQPLNLTNKNRKRAISEMSEPVTQKSLIKELLLKNLSSSDMQCPYCKMIFQTVTELDVHKYRSCKGKPSNTKYSRSSSVNVASILTQNKNAFDDIPHLQNTVFPLNSPGPFLGKTRLVEADKTKSFSFDSGNLPLMSPGETSPMFFPSGTLQLDKEKKPVRLFGGEVKVQSSGETKSFKVDANSDQFQQESSYMEYGGKLSENRVVKSSLQSGGTMLTNKANYNKQDLKGAQEVIRVYDKNTLSPSIEILNFTKQKFTFDKQYENPTSEAVHEPSRILDSNTKPYPNEYKYTNIADFSQNAVKMLTPNIKQPSFGARPEPKQETENVVPLEPKSSSETQKFVLESKPLYTPLNLFVNGKVVRHVPGMPGPVVAAEAPVVDAYEGSIVTTKSSPIVSKIVNFYVQQQKILNDRIPTDRIPTGENKSKELSPRVPEIRLPSREPQSSSDQETKKFVRPNSLALKPTTAALKQHHGLTPTMFNQILISPDTPRVEKKYAEHFLHGNYFSYLGLKSSTKPVYCTLNKTQPFYVHHFNTLSMYSEWRQQDTKQDKFYASNYDSRQKNRRYTVAGKPTANLIIHSSYKFIVSETSSSKMDKLDEQQKNCVLPGGYESNEDYTYIRGRGRGRYVCDQCGIRCKKPSMLKKHIRTHSNDRPYTCSHCNFSFKTKGNLTKHMKSKAHTKNYTASNSSGSSTQQSPQGSESDTEDSGMDSSDESTRQQEHEAAYGLLSLSQKPTQTGLPSNSELPPLPSSGSDFSISTEEVVYVSKTNYAKNKILDERNPLNFASRRLNEVATFVPTTEETTEMHNVRTYLGKCSVSRPLTYPYTTVLSSEREVKAPEPPGGAPNVVPYNATNSNEPKNIKQFHVIQKYIPHTQLSPTIPIEKESLPLKKSEVIKRIPSPIRPANPPPGIMLVVNDNVSDLRKRKISIPENKSFKNKIQKNDEVMDLSMPVSQQEKVVNGADNAVYSEFRLVYMQRNAANEMNNSLHKGVPNNIHRYEAPEDKEESYRHKVADHENNNSSTVIILSSVHDEGRIYVDEQTKVPPDYDNSAMETLADVATKQVKLEKNTLAKSVASEFLKLATKNDNPDGCIDAGKFAANNKDVNELIVKSEGNKSCTICAKSFNKPSQLRLHMNIHYLERPFRCDPCSVSFRTKGHLQKHERSASHHNKLSSSPALSSSEPRPFKCSDCNIAFRIHGHLAKHLRSKMHIMKLECLAKVPFGLYAELERSNSLLTEINTSDGDQCLESLKTLAKKVFINDPT